MKIPKEPGERVRFYEEIVRQCLISRSRRFEFYKTLRNYYLFGTADATGAPYNKIASTVDTLTSFIYGPAATRFSIHLGTTADISEVAKIPALNAEINDQWRATRTYLSFGLGLRWSFVFGCMIFKCLWDDKTSLAKTYLVEPHQFGVWREDMTELTEQEAFVHCYTITRTQLELDLENNPRRAEIMARVGQSHEETKPYSAGLGRLILSGPVAGVPGSVAVGRGGGSVTGGIGATGSDYNYTPDVEAELIDMFELYVFNDDIGDFQMVTMAKPDVVIYDRPQPGIPQVGPFVKLAPENSTYDYFWGDSFVAKLTTLQDMRTQRFYEIMELLKKNVDPPYAIKGATGIAEEKILALRKAGGITNLGQMGEATPQRPTVPPELFHDLAQIDQMFDDQAGVAHILQGKGEPGVRSKGQADLLARLGSARPKSRSLMVEDAASEIATLMLRYVQQNSKQRFQETELPSPSRNALSSLMNLFRTQNQGPMTFIAAQFTKDYEVKVDAHSSSPVFIEDRKNDANTLLEAHAIDRETFLEMYDPPDLPVLKQKLKIIEAKEAQARQMETAQETKGKNAS